MTEGRLGEFVARKVNFEEFLQPWINAGYAVSDESMERLARIDALWDENGNPFPEKIQLIRSDNKLIVVPRQDVTSEEYEEIAVQLQKGQNVQEELQAFRQKNSELEHRLEKAEQELEGTDEAIGGKKKALTQLDQELESKGRELFAQKEDLKKNIKELKAELQDSYKEKEARVQQNLRDLHESENKIEKEIISKKEELEKVDAELVSKSKELESVGSEIDGKSKEFASLQKRAEEVKSLEEMQKSIAKKEFTIQKMLHSVLPEADPSKKESVVAFYNAVGALFTKLDEVSAYILADECSSEEQVINGEPKSKVDIYIGLLERMKDVYDNKAAEVKTAAEIKQRIDIARIAASSEDLQDEEIQPSAVLDEKAEELLDDLLGVVYDDLSADELADPVYISGFVDEIRQCGFELYSMLASKNPEGLAYALDQVAKYKHEEGNREAAIELTSRGIALCKERLPEDKEILAQFEENLKKYRENSE
ncbi:hypothetical protein GF351_01415 [Candidatus Woesearchaeota archaeon]|nr:hypothetical protein [Candidatus Woesearchaeota archaeon]